MEYDEIKTMEQLFLERYKLQEKIRTSSFILKEQNKEIISFFSLVKGNNWNMGVNKIVQFISNAILLLKTIQTVKRVVHSIRYGE